MGENEYKNIRDGFEIDWSDLVKFGLIVMLIILGIYFWPTGISTELKEGWSLKLSENTEFVQGINTEGDLLVTVSSDAFFEKKFVIIFGVHDEVNKIINFYGITSENSLLVYTVAMSDTASISNIAEVDWYYAVNKEFEGNTLRYNVARYSYWLYVIYGTLAIAIYCLILSCMLKYRESRCIKNADIRAKYFLLKPKYTSGG